MSEGLFFVIRKDSDLTFLQNDGSWSTTFANLREFATQADALAVAGPGQTVQAINSSEWHPEGSR
jgi:hypothetical protein